MFTKRELLDTAVHGQVSGGRIMRAMKPLAASSPRHSVGEPVRNPGSMPRLP
jgi:hypothetical protein